MEHVDFTSGWNSLISGIEGSTGNLLLVLAAVGAAIVIFFVCKWLYQRRSGGGGMSGFPWAAVVLGAALASPKAIVPLLLLVLSFIVNFAIDLLNSFV